MSLQMQSTGVQFAVARVNLLPPEVDAARGGRSLKIALAAGLGVVGAFIAVGCVITSGHVGVAQDALDAEQAKTVGLQRAQAQYAEVPKVLNQLRVAQSVDDSLSGSGLRAYELLDSVAATTPGGISFTSVDLKGSAPAAGPAATGAATSATAAAAAGAVDPLAVAGVGTLTVVGQTNDQASIVAWMRLLDSAPSFDDVRLTSSTLDPTTKQITFNATATVTTADAGAQATPTTGGATS